MLPSGWSFQDPANVVRPWRAVRWERSGSLKIEVEAATQEQAVEWAHKIEAGAAAVVKPSGVAP
jgi:hypothetical protein